MKKITIKTQLLNLPRQISQTASAICSVVFCIIIVRGCWPDRIVITGRQGALQAPERPRPDGPDLGCYPPLTPGFTHLHATAWHSDLSVLEFVTGLKRRLVIWRRMSSSFSSSGYMPQKFHLLYNNCLHECLSSSCLAL